MLHRVERMGTWMLSWLGFRSEWIDTGAGRVHVMRRGAASGETPLVLIHGIGASHIHWFFVILRLLRKFPHLVLPDLPNHGLSTRGSYSPGQIQTAFLSSMASVLNQPAWVVGNSLGGLAGIGLAVHQPESVRGLILVSPGGAPETQEQFDDFMQQFKFNERQGAKAFLQRIYRRPPVYLGLMVAPVLAEFTRPGFRRFVESAKPSPASHGEDLRALTMPVALVWGTEDRLMPAHHRQWYLDHLPEGASVLEPEMGHCPHLDDSGALVGLISGFVDGHQLR